MARFAVHRGCKNEQLFVDCQAERLSHLKTRFVVPLLPARTFGVRIGALNPEVMIDGEPMVLGTQYAFTIPLPDLGGVVGTLENEDHRIVLALDVLIGTA